MRSSQMFAGLMFLSFLVPGAQAQDSAFTMSPATYSNWAALAPMRERLEKSHQTLFGQSVQASLSSSRSRPALSAAVALGPAGSGLEPASTRFHFRPVAAGQRVSRVMAQPYPEANRAQAEQVFEQLLAGFRKIESQLGLPSNDVATAVAAFLVGNVSVFRNTPVPDEHFVTLVDQMRHVIGNTPAFVQASPVTRQEAYEQLAILGMFMATTKMALDREPNAKASTEARAAAASYLRAFLATEPDRVQLTASGLKIR